MYRHHYDHKFFLANSPGHYGDRETDEHGAVVGAPDESKTLTR
jgi:hypothetical protein